MYDVIIIGAGPAGISASLYAKRANLNTAVIYNGESAKRSQKGRFCLAGCKKLNGNIMSKVFRIIQRIKKLECKRNLAFLNLLDKKEHKIYKNYLTKTNIRFKICIEKILTKI